LARPVLGSRGFTSPGVPFRGLHEHAFLGPPGPHSGASHCRDWSHVDCLTGTFRNCLREGESACPYPCGLLIEVRNRITDLDVRPAERCWKRVQADFALFPAIRSGSYLVQARFETCCSRLSSGFLSILLSDSCLRVFFHLYVVAIFLPFQATSAFSFGTRPPPGFFVNSGNCWGPVPRIFSAFFFFVWLGFPPQSRPL